MSLRKTRKIRKTCKTRRRMTKPSPFLLKMDGDRACGETEKDWITPTICIGNLYSNYKEFDIVINANYPYNKARHGSIAEREKKLNHRYTLYLVGLCDHDSEPILEYVDKLIPRLRMKYEENPKRKFLFHCFGGRSRSVTLALAFMVEVMGMKFKDALKLVKEKRQVVKPRPLFIEALRRKY